MPEGTPDESDSPAERPEPSDADIDARWAEITAQLSDLRARSDGEARPAAAAPTPGTDPDPGIADERSHSGPPSGPRDYDLPEDEAGFIPPDPPPLQTSDPLPTLAWFLALGGPILTVLFLIVWPSAPSWVYLAAILASILGWLVLLWRMPRGRGEDGGDDGAVV